MTKSEYISRINPGLTREGADKLFRDIYADKDLSANDVGEILSALMSSDVIKGIGEQMKQEWIAKGMTRDVVNARARGN